MIRHTFAISSEGVAGLRYGLTTMRLPESMQQLVFDKLVEEPVNAMTAKYRYVDNRIYLRADNNGTFAL